MTMATRLLPYFFSFRFSFDPLFSFLDLDATHTTRRREAVRPLQLFEHTHTLTCLHLGYYDDYTISDDDSDGLLSPVGGAGASLFP